MMKTRLIICRLFMMLALLVIPQKVDAVDSPAKAGAGQRLKTIIVNNYHPYTFMNDKDEPDGFSVEIARAVAKAMDLELEIRVDKWDVAMKELEAGSIDLLPMMAKSPERDKIFDFSVPHTIAYDAIFLKKGNSDLRTLNDLSGKTVIVMNRDIAHSYLLSSGLTKTLKLNLVDSLPEALKQLSTGKGDAAIMPKLVGIVTAKNLNLTDIETSPQLIGSYTRPFSFAVKDGNQALLERLNQGLNIIKSSGEYDAIYKKWFGALEDPHLELKTALKYGSVVVLILLGSVIWNVMLKRQVKGKTEHLEAEIAVRKQIEQELQNKNNEMERFTYTVSHDLKSPLITIQAYAGMILKDMEAGKYERASADLKKIEGAAGKMNDLLNDLLELSRAGRMMGEPSRIDMNRLVSDVLAQLTGVIKQSQVEVVVQPDLPAVLGDHKRIAQVVQNLIENAIKYRGDQTAPRLEIGTRQDGKESVFFVKDNGAGIDPLQHERIFGLFNKLDAESEGTGVGLALVKRIIEVHGGRVWVESEGVGMGSCFCFELPILAEVT